jgi:putative restriction endonuclease
MRIYVYPTDKSWFDFLASKPGLDEVNFWRPGGRVAFTGLTEGEILLFRLKSPINRIAGGGVFLRAGLLPLSLMWESFGDKNGTSSLDMFRAAIAKFRKVGPLERLALDTTLGYMILLDPVFLPRAQWIPVPEDFQLQLVQGRGYDVSTGTGRELFLWAQSELFRRRPSIVSGPTPEDEDLGPTLGPRTLVRQRLGQGAFRIVVTEIYERRCAITGERTLPVLEAAHIQPVSDGGEHRASNGLLLRSDIHSLFDLGYVGIDPDFKFRVSEALREKWHNGRVYYDFDGRGIRPPDSSTVRPSRELLSWHMKNIYRG